MPTNTLSNKEYSQLFLFSGTTSHIMAPSVFKDEVSCLQQESAAICGYYFDNVQTIIKLLEKWANDMKPPDGIKNWPQIEALMRISR